MTNIHSALLLFFLVSNDVYPPHFQLSPNPILSRTHPYSSFAPILVFVQVSDVSCRVGALVQKMFV